MTDPILNKTTKRFTTFPIEYPTLWNLYKKATASFWTVDEIDFTKDFQDFQKLSSNEQHFIKTILAFFASSDGIVFENLDLNFVQEVFISEARSFYAYQGFNESIHGETYSLLIDTLIQDPNEKEKLFNAIENVPCVARKAEWALKWFDRDLIPFCDRLVAFACVEGIFFSGSFCAIFWIKNRNGTLPGLCFSNELISRDEGLHQEFAVELYHTLQSKTSRERILEIVQSAVDIETEFIINAVPVKMIGMDSEKMIRYIKFVADRLLKSITGTIFYNEKNPFDWMEHIALDGKTNFFERRVGEYSKSSCPEISFNEDF
jgi:ribonucleotide reductase beta subunit family protein with ferritin-like domain